MYTIILHYLYLRVLLYIYMRVLNKLIQNIEKVMFNFSDVPWKIEIEQVRESLTCCH